MTVVEQVEPKSVEASPEAMRAAARLDEDHAPETNGRMAVCRRCGMRTLGPLGGHAPAEAKVARAEEWLKMQVLNARIAVLKDRRDT